MKKEIRDTRFDLYKKSLSLREIALDCNNCEKSRKIRSEQDKLYKKWKFYNNIIKANDNIKRNM